MGTPHLTLYKIYVIILKKTIFKTVERVCGPLVTALLTATLCATTKVRSPHPYDRARLYTLSIALDSKRILASKQIHSKIFNNDAKTSYPNFHISVRGLILLLLTQQKYYVIILCVRIFK